VQRPRRPGVHGGTEPAARCGGYHNQGEVPNYWTYAKDFVLDDHMFEPVSSWSEPTTSTWSRAGRLAAPTSPHELCEQHHRPVRCPAFQPSRRPGAEDGTTSIDLAWTDETWLLYRDHVSWAYYIQTGYQPDCENDSAETCPPVRQSYQTAGIWNPLPLFEDVHQDHQLENIQPLSSYFTAAKAGPCRRCPGSRPHGPTASTPVQRPSGPGVRNGDHQRGHEEPGLGLDSDLLVLGRLGRVLRRRPPAKGRPERLRPSCPSIVISPYARRGYIDHQVLSSDAYLKFIEDDFLGGARLNPKTDGRPDPRPDVREDEPVLGNLVQDFNFDQSPGPRSCCPPTPNGLTVRTRVLQGQATVPRVHGRASRPLSRATLTARAHGGHDTSNDHERRVFMIP